VDDNIRGRLVKCFSAVFPALTENEIHNASPYTVGTWDSVATVTLLLVVQEEFGVAFDAEELDRLTSFKEILDYLSKN
jgi:acyl carrier protein